MDTKSFLTRVLPAAGGYVLHSHTRRFPGATGHKDIIFRNNGCYNTIDEFVAEAAKLDQAPLTQVFFAVLSHKDNLYSDGAATRVRRTQQTAYMAKCLCFDLDVGDKTPYPTAKEGVRAFELARTALGLPEPMIVRSGKGVHIYWPLKEDLPKDQWVKTSAALSNALSTNNLTIDVSKVFDSSMVLRPAGMHHKKDEANWREVRVVQDCPDYDFADIYAILEPYHYATPNGKKTDKTKKSSPLLDAILNNNDFPPVNLDHVIEGCAQIRALAESGGALDAAGMKAREPLWRNSMGIVAYMRQEEMAEGVVRLAGKHEGFDLDASLNKIDNWRGSGPTYCSTIERECPSGCNGCPHKGKITSPALLTRGEKLTVVENEVTGETEEVRMPAGYFVKHGFIYREFTNVRKEKDSEGKTIEVEFTDVELVCPYVLWVTGRYQDMERGTAVCVLKVRYPTNSVETFDLSLSALSVGGAELGKALGNMQVLLRNEAQLRNTRSYLMTYLQEIQAAVDTSYVHDTLGWQQDNSFLCGATLIGSEVTDFRLSGPAKRQAEFIHVKGDRDVWVDTVKIFGHEEMLLHGFFFLGGVGGLLMKGSTLDSFMLNMFSPDSGVGKTFTQAAIISAWGNPRDMFLQITDTDNALFRSFGALNSFSPCIDEITMIEPDRLANMLYRISSGIDKGRMDQTAELRARAKWKTVVVGSSNKDLYAALETSTGGVAQKLRLFQAYFPKNKFMSDNGKRLVMLLHRNYGHAAPEIAKWIIDHGGPDKVYEEAANRLFSRGYLFDGEERYIEAAFTVVEGTGYVLEQLGLYTQGYVRNLDAGYRALESNRGNTRAMTLDAIDVIGQFTVENNAKIVEYVENKSMPSSKGTVRLPAPDYAVMRLEIARTEKDPVVSGRVCIVRPELKKYLGKIGIDFTKVLMELRDAGALLAENERVSIYKGCDRSNPGQAYCVILDANHPRIRSVLVESKGQTIAVSPRMAVLQAS